MHLGETNWKVTVTVLKSKKNVSDSMNIETNTFDFGEDKVEALKKYETTLSKLAESCDEWEKHSFCSVEFYHHDSNYRTFTSVNLLENEKICEEFLHIDKLR